MHANFEQKLAIGQLTADIYYKPANHVLKVGLAKVWPLKAIICGAKLFWTIFDLSSQLVPIL